VQLWDSLNSTVSRGESLVVSGPPGTGKSTEAWAWALWRAWTMELTVTWFHCSRNDSVKVVIDGATKKITWGHSAKAPDIENSDGTLLLFDGLTKEESVTITRACCVWRRQGISRQFVLVSSMSIPVALEQDEEANIVRFTVASWTLEQYHLACENDGFYNSIKANLMTPNLDEKADKTEHLLSKYDLAGGCARWMFEFNYGKWLADFNTHFEKVTDYQQLYRESSGDQNVDAVNHLRGVTVLTLNLRQTKHYFFVSKHAACELAKKCDDEAKRKTFLIASYAKAAETKNPAFHGWIFEFDIDFQLRTAHTKKTEFVQLIRSADGKLSEERRLVSVFTEFDSAANLAPCLRTLQESAFLWAKPTLWCNKSFDFLCFWKANSKLNMLAANATVGQTHTVKLDGVNKLATALGSLDCTVHAIRFDFLVPIGRATLFQVGALQGRLCAWDNLAGRNWPNSAEKADFEGFITVAGVAPTSDHAQF
jgi:hypothetical protein